MKIFIDFDDVLFNTREFKRDLINIFITNGISKQQFTEESYWDGKYNLKQQIKSVEKKYGVDGSRIKKETQRLFKNLNRYVFPDVEKFFHGTNKSDLILVSYGDEEIQMEKIRQAGMSNSFNKIVITHNKAKTIMTILKKKKITLGNPEGKQIYFLDDRVDYIEEVKQILPVITTILVQRVEGRYHDKPTKSVDKVINGLEEFMRLK